MRSEVLINLVVVVLYTGLTAAGQPAQPIPGDIIRMAVEEPNAPEQQVSLPGEDAAEPWNPEEHLRATWESISGMRTHRIYNPALPSPRGPEGPHSSLALTGQMDITNSNGLVGFSTMPRAALALDQDGRVVFSEMTNSLLDRPYQAPRYVWKPSRRGECIPEIQPYPFSVDLPVGPGMTYPQVLDTLEWSMHALVADQSTTVDLPFQAGGTWFELVPGLKVLVEQAVTQNAQYQFRLRAEHDSREVSWLLAGTLNLPAGQTPPCVIVVDLDVLDANGRSIRSLGSVSGGIGIDSAGTEGTGDQTTNLVQEPGNGPTGGAPALLSTTTMIRGTGNGSACG